LGPYFAQNFASKFGQGLLSSDVIHAIGHNMFCKVAKTCMVWDCDA